MRRIVLAFLIACSSGTSGSPGPTGPTPPTTPDAAPSPVTMTREECEEMVMHVVDLTIAEQDATASTPKSNEPPASERDKVRAGLEPFVVECSTLRPEVHRCALAARTLAQVSACQSKDSDHAK